jgi:flavin-dependent dehydrogenase
MSADYDAVVVGGRVAGASTAMLLARAGARVALVDRALYGSDTISTHGLMRAGVLQLSRWGLLDKVIAAGTPPIRRTVFHYAGAEPEQVSIRSTAGVDALYAPRRRVLDPLLVDAAAEAGAEVRHEAPVTALLRDDNGRVRGIRTQGRSGGCVDLRATITVGADGIRSTIANEVGAPVVRRGSAQSAFLYRYYADARPVGYELGYAIGSAAGLIPTNDGLTCVFVGTTPTRMRALRRDGTEHAFGTLLAQTAPLLADQVASAQPIDRLHGWAGVPGFVRRSWGPGWALVGDAGYYNDPITMHGMTDALRDAELLTGEILAALTAEVPESVALARYQATRERLSSRFREATETVASYDWDLEQLRTLLRRVSSAMSDEVEHLWSRPVSRIGSGSVPLLLAEQQRA